MMAVANKISKACSVCQETVHVGEGYAVHCSGEWYTYHKNCVPAELNATVAENPSSKDRAEITEDGCVFIPYNAAHVELIKTIPNRKWDKEQGCWKFPLVEASINRAVEIGRLLNIKIADSLQTIVPEQKKCKKFDKMYDYQKEGAQFLASRSAALLGDEMGTGKTVQTLCALPHNARVLIVCPASLKFNWVKEANTWRPDYLVSMLSSTKSNSIYEVSIIVGKDNFRLPEKNEIMIINRELLPDMLLPTKGKDDKYPTCNIPDDFKNLLQETYIIVDEAHQFKGTKTDGHKKLRTLTRNARSTWALTGTPLLNRPEDLWGVFAACNLEKVAFNKYGMKPYDYFYNLFDGKQARFGTEWGTPSKDLPEIMSRVRLARKRKDVLPQLPEKTYTDILVSLDDSGDVIKKQLDNLEKEYATLLGDGKLPPFQAFSRVRSQIAKSRIPAMLNYIEDCEEQEVPLVVFSVHLAPLDALRFREGWRVIDGQTTTPEDRQQIVDDFQNGKLKGIALTIGTGGTGWTLTKAWKVLFVDMDWVPANNKQAESRVLRVGQTSNKVEIIRFVSEHPLDRRLFELIDQKETLIKKTFEKDESVSQESSSALNSTKKGFNYVETVCEYESVRSHGKVNVLSRDQAFQEAKKIIETKPDDWFYPLISRTDVRALKNLTEKYESDPLFLQAVSFIVGRYQETYNRMKSDVQPKN